MVRIRLCGVLLPLLFSWQAAADGDTGSASESMPDFCDPKPMELDIRPIFDPEKTELEFFHRWANYLHIDTAESTIKRESAFFQPHCQPTKTELAELERHLRSRKYLRDAKVSFDEQSQKVKVTTWDNWSLMPTLSFGRKGGKNKGSIGIKDRNFLGQGIGVNMEYYSNQQQQHGYKFSGNFPLWWQKNASASFNFANGEDDNRKAVTFEQPFVSRNSQTGYRIGINDETRTDYIYQNTDDEQQWQHQIKTFDAAWGWLQSQTPERSFRLWLGYSRQTDEFSLKDDFAGTVSLPQDRNFSYPWIATDLVFEDYRKMENIRLINSTEDINLGWQISSKLGVSYLKGDQDDNILWQVGINKGYALSDNSLLLLGAGFEGNLFKHRANRFIADLSAELFYTYTPDLRFYLKNRLTTSKNQFKDIPVTVGGDSGVRGFPLQYQHGDDRILVTAEARYYPHINIYDLFELGASLFVDVGKTRSSRSEEVLGNMESGWLQSVGLGARFYSTHSSEQQVIHIDLIHPISDNSEVNTVELRINTEYSF